MKKLNVLIIGALSIIMFITSCKKEENITSFQPENTTNVQQGEGFIKLGKKLENPYSLKNMRQAYKNLKNDTRLKSAMIDEDSNSSICKVSAQRQFRKQYLA